MPQNKKIVQTDIYANARVHQSIYDKLQHSREWNYSLKDGVTQYNDNIYCPYYYLAKLDQLNLIVSNTDDMIVWY